jgi:hypothetical protein
MSFAGLAIGEAGRVLTGETTISRNQHDRSDDPVLVQRAGDHGVETGSKAPAHACRSDPIRLPFCPFPR